LVGPYSIYPTNGKESVLNQLMQVHKYNIKNIVEEAKEDALLKVRL
jgi:hypothetical protein